MADPPRFRLFEAPSPLHPLPRFCEAVLGGRIELWIKREDLLPLAFGGNKLRNLEFLLGAALAEGADTLITSGRRWSNHARLTAAAGARAGLAVHLVLSGPQIEPPGPGIRLSEAFGATVHRLPTADRDERDRTVAEISKRVSAGGGKPSVIGVGGSDSVGAYGQLLAARELLEQASSIGLGIDRVLLPTATGGTQAGLLAGLPPATKVTGIVVARSADELRPVIARTAAELGRRVDQADIDLDEGHIGAGYARPTPAAQEAADQLARCEGLLVDPIYTAKALAGLIAGVRSGGWDGERIVFWHAGGLPGLFEPLDAVSP
jgi:1-aminocyclopropane-1-carboxylate deaminase/D-cysteine desulfhydrase-like pyridoxal-dependent ACC family enzyme